MSKELTKEQAQEINAKLQDVLDKLDAGTHEVVRREGSHEHDGVLVEK